MPNPDWGWLVWTGASLLLVLAGHYNWSWLWRGQFWGQAWARHIEDRVIRLAYAALGFPGLAYGIANMGHSYLHASWPIAIGMGLGLTYVAGYAFFQRHKGDLFLLQQDNEDR